MVPERMEAVSPVMELAGRRAPAGTKSAMMAPPHIMVKGQHLRSLQVDQVSGSLVSHKIRRGSRSRSSKRTMQGLLRSVVLVA
jgi:hypothetical protein